MEERLTKKERKEQRKLEALKKMEEGKGSDGMKKIIIGAAIILFLAFGVFAILASKQKATAPVVLSSSGWVTGNPASKVTVTEFGDFQCPACLAFEPTMRQIRSIYGKTVKIVFKQFPLKQVHPNAMAAAIAAEAAGQQGKFWQFHDLLYDNQNTWAPLADPSSEFIKYAKSLKLNMGKFTKALQDKTLADRINAQEDEGARVGVNSTPTIFINGTFLGSPSYDLLKKEIDKDLTVK